MKKYKLLFFYFLPILLLNLTGCYTQVASRDDYGNWNREESKPYYDCLLYTSDAADERSSVDLGGRRIINKKTNEQHYSL